MARTFRNRHMAPHGYVVRDGGVLFCPTCCSNKKALWANRGQHHCACFRKWCEHHFRANPMHRECKAYRKAHYRRYRAKVKDRMTHEDWENIPRLRRTSGWLTW